MPGDFMGTTLAHERCPIYGRFMLERLGEVCGWAGTGLASLTVVWGFLTWSAGNGEPLYFGVLAALF